MDIHSICSSITDLVTNKMRTPAKAISGIIMLCSLSKRPGLSAIISTARIIEKISKEGLVTEDMPDGTPNLMNKLAYEISREVIRALKEDMNGQISFGPMSLQFQATGANEGGVAVLEGGNINYGKGVMLMQ